MWYRAKSAASYCSQIMTEMFCRLKTKYIIVQYGMCSILSQAAVLLHFKNKNHSRSLHDSVLV